MRATLFVTCASLAALSTTARAGDADAVAIRKVVDAEAKAIAKQDPSAFGATIAPDAFVMLPGGYAIGPDKAGLAMSRWKNSDHTIMGAKVGKAVIGHAGDVAWATIDVTLKISSMDAAGTHDEPYRVTALYTRDHATWKARAMYATAGVTDLAERWAGAQTNETIPGTDAAATAPVAGWFARTADLAAHLHTGDDVTVLGSAPAERAAGTAAAAKLLGAWKKLAFTVDWLRAGGDGKTFAWVAGRVVRRVKIKGAPDDIPEPYWAMVLAVRGTADWEIVSVHYGQDPPEFTMGNPCE